MVMHELNATVHFKIYHYVRCVFISIQIETSHYCMTIVLVDVMRIIRSADT